jgi:hypothetical protein
MGIVRKAQTQAANVDKQRYVNPLTAIGSMLAATIFGITSLIVAAVTAAAIVFVVPWLLVTPLVLVGLLIRLAGFVLGGLGLV